MNTRLRTGHTTGTCAAAAAKAAASLLTSGAPAGPVDTPLPGGGRVALAPHETGRDGEGAWASIIKDAGDDPDITHGAAIVARVEWMAEGGVEFAAGEGVGMVTKPGLSIPPGEPAINPVPRRMIAAAVREVTDRPARVAISIPGGARLAEKTFNPRLGVVGGLSILGTTGIVRPFSCSALRSSLVLGLDVALASGFDAPVFTPGAIGARAAEALFGVPGGAVVEVSNEWGYVLGAAALKPLRALLAMGHPGKLAKLPMGHWDTHSKRSPAAVEYARAVAAETLGALAPESDTVEGVFTALEPGARRRAGDALAERVASAIHAKVGGRFPVAAALVTMSGELLGMSAGAREWRAR